MSVMFIDCDVEAPNAHLFLKPTIDSCVQATLPTPVVDDTICNRCAICADVCQYNAIAVVGKQVLIFPDRCHGCGSCLLNCPEGAISEVPETLGVLERGRTDERIDFAQGTLNIGKPLAVPVIKQLKQWVLPYPNGLIIIDSPPGTTCPVVEAVHGANFVLLVTEPTPFGLHDLALAYGVTQALNIPAGVIVNRDGIGDSSVDEFCKDVGLPVLQRIPLDRGIAESTARGVPLVTHLPEYRDLLRQVLDAICDLV
jgi:MinD superfamily P-loop ATPase